MIRVDDTPFAEHPQHLCQASRVHQFHPHFPDPTTKGPVLQTERYPTFFPLRANRRVPMSTFFPTKHPISEWKAKNNTIVLLHFLCSSFHPQILFSKQQHARGCFDIVRFPGLRELSVYKLAVRIQVLFSSHEPDIYRRILRTT